MNYSEEHWIKVYTRDTASWLALSWQARGLALEIARKLPQSTGELRLGRRGLEALAALLRAPWQEIEPYVRELIEDGRLKYDAKRQIIRDPQHVRRQQAQSSAAQRKRRQREREAAERGAAERPGVEQVAPPRNTPPPPSSSDVVSRDVSGCHAESRDVTDSHTESQAVTSQSQDVTIKIKNKIKIREEEEREREREKESTRAREGLPLGGRTLRPDEPLTGQRLMDHAALTGFTDPREPEPEWRMFVDDRIARSVVYGSEAAIDADWRKWVSRETTFRQKARIKSQGTIPSSPAERPIDSRQAAAYAAGITEAKGSPWVWPGGRADDDLAKLIEGHAKDPAGKSYKGDQLLRFLSFTAKEFAEDVIRRGEIQYYSAFEPRGCIRWLNEDAMIEEARRVG